MTVAESAALASAQPSEPRGVTENLSTRGWLLTALVLGASLVAFVTSDPWFSILDDETTIIIRARQPLSETIGAFLFSTGRNEHPPLSDILLHVWVSIGDLDQAMLRLPSVILYLTGLLLLALAARRIAGVAAFAAVIAIGVLSPFAFHFARLAGWYSFCFFLISALTLTYVAYVERPTRWRAALFVALGVCLTYANYYAWIVLLCFAADAVFVLRHRAARRLLVITIGLAALAYAPIGVAFLAEVRGHGLGRGGGSPLLAVMNAPYNLYVTFVSESFAPWFWWLGVPVALAIVASLWAAFQASRESRKWLIYFAVLFGVMAVLDLLNTKRLLFIFGWLILAFAIALADYGKRRLRLVLGCALAVIGATGWFGIFARSYYAAPHFIEPWAPLADRSAVLARNGVTIISNSAPFLFDLQDAVRRGPPAAQASVRPNIIAINVPDGALHGPLRDTLFVRGVNENFARSTREAQAWLDASCTLIHAQSLVPDTGSSLKSVFYGAADPERPTYRISLQRFDCARPPHAAGLGPAIGQDVGSFR